MSFVLRAVSTVAMMCCLPMVPVESISARSQYWEQRVTLFEELPIGNKDIVFLGNSITDGGEFDELLHNENIKNRGISGDVVSGVRERLNQVTAGNPDKIFLLIGINDLAHNSTVEEVAREYESLVKEILTASPSTRLYIQSVLPINNDYERFTSLNGKEKDVVKLNDRLKGIADDNNVIYIDLFSLLADENGRLKDEYTNDGLHLLGKGYRVWSDYIKTYINE